MPCGGEGLYAHLLRSSASSHTQIPSYSMRRSWVRMEWKKKRRATHLQRTQLIHILVCPTAGGAEVKKNWRLAVWLLLLRLSSQGLQESSRSMTWTSVCIPRLSKVSKGLRVFAFFIAAMSLSSISVGAGDESLDVLRLRAAHLPVLWVREPGAGVLSTWSSESTGSGKGDGDLRGDNVAVIGPPSFGVTRADAVGRAGWPWVLRSWPPASSAYLARGKIVQEGWKLMRWKCRKKEKSTHTLCKLEPS